MKLKLVLLEELLQSSGELAAEHAAAPYIYYLGSPSLLFCRESDIILLLILDFSPLDAKGFGTYCKLRVCPGYGFDENKGNALGFAL